MVHNLQKRKKVSTRKSIGFRHSFKPVIRAANPGVITRNLFNKREKSSARMNKTFYFTV